MWIKIILFFFWILGLVIAVTLTTILDIIRDINKKIKK